MGNNNDIFKKCSAYNVLTFHSPNTYNIYRNINAIKYIYFRVVTFYYKNHFIV